MSLEGGTMHCLASCFNMKKGKQTNFSIEEVENNVMNIVWINSKLYRYRKPNEHISRNVEFMLPGNPQGLPDDYLFSNNLGGVF